MTKKTPVSFEKITNQKVEENMTTITHHNERFSKRRVPRRIVLLFASIALTSQSLMFSAYLVGILTQKPMMVSSLQPSHDTTSSNGDFGVVDDTFIEIEGHTIGDEHRSETSSKQFFNFIDTDRDGKLEQTELSKFLKDHIGGMTLDTDVEAQMEAEAILDRLDHNNDDQLDSKDVFRYWKSLESLLTVEEVAEWVVHSVQLPAEIGEIFRQNHVTGYDFPELVANGGRALLDELKIEKQTFRKKIVRLVNARMLGIGGKPDPPHGIKIELEGCSTAILKWKRSKADGFPVHKFRVQRRRLSGDYDPILSNHSEMMPEEKCLDEKKGNDDASQVCKPSTELDRHIGDLMEYSSHHPKTCAIHEHNEVSCKDYASGSSRNILGWRNVYDQSLPEFHDFGLERGYRGYQYRIQAWNAVGKSDWVMAEVKQWGRKKCHRFVNQKAQEVNASESSSLLSLILFFFESLYSLSSIIWGLLFAAGGIIKLQRASLPSTVGHIEPIHTYVLKLMKNSTRSIFGFDIIPYFFKSENNDGKSNQNISYEVSVNQHKVAGFEQISKRNNLTKSSDRMSSNINFDNMNSFNSREEDTMKITPSNLLRKMSSKKLISKSESSRSNELKSPQIDASLRLPCSTLPSSDERQTDPLPDQCVEVENDDDDDDIIPKRLNPTEKSSDNHCSICQRKFKYLKRKRHHCSICYASFCHKHGKTTHSNLVPCKVPGDCVCNQCLERVM